MSKVNLALCGDIGPLYRAIQIPVLSFCLLQMQTCLDGRQCKNRVVGCIFRVLPKHLFSIFNVVLLE